MKTKNILLSRKVNPLLNRALFFSFLTIFSIVYSKPAAANPSLDTNAAVQSPVGSKNPRVAVAGSGGFTSTLLSQWWNGESPLDQWFGLGPVLSSHGLTVTGSAMERFLGQVSGGYPSANQPQSNWINEEKLNALLNFGQLFGVAALDGLTFSSTWRYRNIGSNPGFASGTATGPSSTFNPSAQTTGLGVRILPQYLQWASDSSGDPRFLINAGWENPFEQFLQQPLSKDFMNNNICTAKGIGATLGAGIPYFNGVTTKLGTVTTTTQKAKFFNTSGVPWSSSYAAWGGP